jgi:peptidylprolyl isomerase
MAQAKTGDTVRVKYTGRLEDGTEFYNCADKEPMQFVIGKEEVIAGFEEAVIGMNQGETKTVKITPDKGYGPILPELRSVISRAQFPAHIIPEVGQILRVTSSTGENLLIKVMSMTETDVTVDGNHPLAGRDLTYDITLLEIVAPDAKCSCSCEPKP